MCVDDCDWRPARLRNRSRFLCVVTIAFGLGCVAAARADTSSAAGTIQTSVIAASFAADIQPPAAPTRMAMRQDRPIAVQPPPLIGQSATSAGAWPASTGINAAWRAGAESVYGGAEYLLLRTHFSQGIAFVEVGGSVVNGLPNQSVTAKEINFPYTSAFRVYMGYHLSQNAALQLTYFYLNNSTSVFGSPGPGQTFIDAYGSQATAGQTLGGTSLVRLNVFDLDLVGRYPIGRQFVLRPAAGVRWADVRQHNDSTLSSALGPLTVGTFNTHFSGFGPHGSLLGQAYLAPNSPFSLIARGAGSLLAGGYSNVSGAVISGVAGGQQVAHRFLTVPVVEAEVGGAWQPTPNLMFSAGWLWQAWFDLGVSGGTTYNGKYAEADSAGIMAFDGLFLRGLWRY